jgi:membrane-associated protease RseP (regulator of RpoE activity)
MGFPLVTAVCCGVAFLGHALLARLLGARGLPFLRTLTGQVDLPGPLARRVALALAGPLTLYAVLVTLFFAGTLGRGDLAPTLVVPPELPAGRAGLRGGDRVLAVQGRAVRTFSELREGITAGRGGPLRLEVRRGEETLSFEVTPGADGRIGVSPTLDPAPVPVGAALAEAAAYPFSTALVTARALLERLGPARPTGGAPLAGPVARFDTGGWDGWMWLQVLALSGSIAWALLLAVSTLGLARALRPPRALEAPSAGGALR